MLISLSVVLGLKANAEALLPTKIGNRCSGGSDLGGYNYIFNLRVLMLVLRYVTSSLKPLTKRILARLIRGRLQSPWKRSPGDVGMSISTVSRS